MSEQQDTKALPDEPPKEERFSIKLIIQTTFPAPPTRFEITLPATATIKDLCDTIYEETAYKPEIFSLKLRLLIPVPTDDPEKLLSECKFSTASPNPLMVDRSPAFKDSKSEIFVLPALR
jgi:hypothetical protein